MKKYFFILMFISLYVLSLFTGCVRVSDRYQTQYDYCPLDINFNEMLVASVSELNLVDDNQHFLLDQNIEVYQRFYDGSDFTDYDIGYPKTDLTPERIFVSMTQSNGALLEFRWSFDFLDLSTLSVQETKNDFGGNYQIFSIPVEFHSENLQNCVAHTASSWSQLTESCEEVKELESQKVRKSVIFE